MKITTVGIDLAKNVFQVHAVNEFGKTVIKRQLRRDQVAEFFENLPSCLIGMEACGSAHHCARKLLGLGHTVKLMAPQFVKPYVKTNRNDAADAEAICEAVARPNMHFVAIKNCRTAVGAGVTPCASGFREVAYSPSQPDPGPAGRVRSHHPAGHREYFSARTGID
jgi:transposase